MITPSSSLHVLHPPATHTAHADTPEVTTALLKFMAEFVLNKTQVGRLTPSQCFALVCPSSGSALCLAARRAARPRINEPSCAAQGTTTMCPQQRPLRRLRPRPAVQQHTLACCPLPSLTECNTP